MELYSDIYIYRRAKINEYLYTSRQLTKHEETPEPLGTSYPYHKLLYLNVYFDKNIHKSELTPTPPVSLT